MYGHVVESEWGRYGVKARVKCAISYKEINPEYIFLTKPVSLTNFTWAS